jgi:hypothetical protein
MNNSSEFHVTERSVGKREIEPRASSREWYGALSSKEKRTFWACFGGWTLDAVDIQMFALPSLLFLLPSTFPMPMRA